MSVGTFVDFVQRGIRGWSDTDAYGLDTHITKVVSDALVFMADNAHSWPGPLAEDGKWPTFESWQQYCRDLGRRVGLYGHIAGVRDDADEEIKNSDTAKDAMMEFSKYLPYFWD